MPSTTLISAGSKRSLRRLYPWGSWILNGTPDKPLKIVVGTHVPKNHKLTSLISQLHHYAKSHNASAKPKDRIQLFTSRLDNATLLVYSVPKTKTHQTAPLYRGHRIGCPANGNGKVRPVNAPTK